MALFRNIEDREPFMRNFLIEQVNKHLLEEYSKKAKINNAVSTGCYLSCRHGLPDKMYIGVYTYNGEDYAFLRFWEYEATDTENVERFKNRETFIENNSDRIKNILGQDFILKSYKNREIKNFVVEGKDALSGLCAYYPPRKKKSDLKNDLEKLSNVLKLIMNKEKKLAQRKALSCKPNAPINTERGVSKKQIVHPNLFLTRNKPMNTKCSKVIIVGPYPTEGFIQRVKDQLNPKRICVVTDSSWKEDEIDKIINLTDGVQKVQSAGVGIVHAKMYYVEYSNTEVQLFFGSVNASENSVDNNSEFISSFWLHSFSDNDQKEIKDYFTNLENGKSAKSLEIKLKSYSTLFFPEILICDDDKENSFRNWIRKGYFYIGYDPDPKFGAIDISLKTNKVDKSNLEKMLKGTPLANEKGGVKSSLSWHYAKSNTSRTSNKTEHWKDQYGVKTDLGCWVSSDCIKELNKERGISKGSGDAIPPPSIERKNIVEYIKQLDVNNQTEANKIDIGIKFYKSISRRKKLMKILDIPPKKSFLESLKDRIIYHKNLLNDDVYRNRYLTKYAKIPASALNEDFLDKIIVDFIDSYNIKSIKGKKDILVEEVKNLKDLPINEKKEKIEDLWKQCPEIFINYYKKEINTKK